MKIKHSHIVKTSKKKLQWKLENTWRKFKNTIYQNLWKPVKVGFSRKL